MLQAFDTLKASKALRDAGFEQAQAEALVVTVNEAVIGNVATKDDLNIVKSELEKEIGALRSEIKEQMAEQSRDLYKQLWVMGLGIVGLTVTLTVGLIAALIMVP